MIALLKSIVKFILFLLDFRWESNKEIVTSDDSTNDPEVPVEEPIPVVQEPIEESIIVIDKPIEVPVEPVEKPKPIVVTPTKNLIITKFLDPKQYVHEKVKFNQIVLHHTAGGSAQSTIEYWNSTGERVGTHFTIDRDGTVYQTVPFDAWIYHLYVGSPSNKIDKKYRDIGSAYDRQSIGIELCNYGFLKPSNGKYLNYANGKVDTSKVTKLDKPYKGFLYWEDYTDEQIESLKYLLNYLLTLFPHIPYEKNSFSSIFDINKKALDMVPGIYSHTSYRTDKFDIYPNTKIINLLNNLK